ncbi:MAG: hypothetical protein K2X39_07320 [Silvanigrellaceae bacterium]|nr:hypothetical protein [Silvanigrellaceae bacterium]
MITLLTLLTYYSRWHIQGKKLSSVFTGIDSRTLFLVQKAALVPDSTQKNVKEILDKDEVGYSKIRLLMLDMRKASLSWLTSAKQRTVIQAKMNFLTQIVDKAIELAVDNAVIGKKEGPLEGVLKQAIKEVSKNVTPETVKIIMQDPNSRTQALLRAHDIHFSKAGEIVNDFKSQLGSKQDLDEHNLDNVSHMAEVKNS